MSSSFGFEFGIATATSPPRNDIAWRYSNQEPRSAVQVLPSWGSAFPKNGTDVKVVAFAFHCDFRALCGEYKMLNPKNKHGVKFARSEKD